MSLKDKDERIINHVKEGRESCNKYEIANNELEISSTAGLLGMISERGVLKTQIRR